MTFLIQRLQGPGIKTPIWMPSLPPELKPPVRGPDDGHGLNALILGCVREAKLLIHGAHAAHGEA